MNLPDERIVYKWLRLLHIPVSSEYINERLLSHPDYPSIASITDTLDALGIDNAAMVVDKDKVKELPLPFLARGYKQSENFTIITDSSNLSATTEFKKWSGIIIAAEKPAQWSNKENNAWLKKDKDRRKVLSGSIAAFSASSLLVIAVNFSWLTCILLLSSLTGLFISFLLIQQELGYDSPVADKLCGTGKNIDCNAVASSKGAKLPFGLSWADAGIVYFGSLCLLAFIALLSGNQNAIRETFPVSSVLSIPLHFFRSGINGG